MTSLQSMPRHQHPANPHLPGLLLTPASTRGCPWHVKLREKALDMRAERGQVSQSPAYPTLPGTSEEWGGGEWLASHLLPLAPCQTPARREASRRAPRRPQSPSAHGRASLFLGACLFLNKGAPCSQCVTVRCRTPWSRCGSTCSTQPLPVRGCGGAECKQGRWRGGAGQLETCMLHDSRDTFK